MDFPQVAGRYLMLTWHPASLQGEAFSIAQVAALAYRDTLASHKVRMRRTANISPDGKEAIGEGPGSDRRRRRAWEATAGVAAIYLPLPLFPSAAHQPLTNTELRLRVPAR